MNPTQRRRFIVRLLSIALVVVLLSVSLPIVIAQDGGDSASTPTGSRGIGAPPPIGTPDGSDDGSVDVDATQETVIIDTTTTFSDDFESLALGTRHWSLAYWQFTTDSEGGYLWTTAAGATATVPTFIQENFEFNTSLRIAPNNIASIAFRKNFNGEYRLVMSTNGSSRLYRNDELLATYNLPQGPAIGSPGSANWLDVQITTAYNTIAVVVNGFPSITYTDNVSLGAGAIVISTGESNTGQVALDNVSMAAINPDAVVLAQAPTPTPIPDRPLPGAPPPIDPAIGQPGALPERVSMQIETNLANALTLFDSDGEIAALSLLDSLGYLINRENEVLIELNPIENITIADLESLAESLDADVYARGENHLEVYARVAEIERLSDSDLIANITSPALVASAGGNTVLPAPAGDTTSIGFDTIAANDWHYAGIYGDGVKVGVISTGFNEVRGVDLADTDYSCYEQTVGNDTGSGNDGFNVVEVLCDIAPNSQVYGFAVSSYARLYDAIIDARNYGMDVLVIALDLGASASPGDGAGAGTQGNSPYQAIAEARENGMVILAAAGNNGTSHFTGTSAPVRYITFDVSQTVDTYTIDFVASAGDQIHIAWNDWEGLGPLSSKDFLEDFKIELFLEDGTEFNDPSGLPYEAGRIAIYDAPSIEFSIPRAETCVLLDPDEDGIGESSCNLYLEITRVKGDSDVVMQVQLIAIADRIRDFTGQGNDVDELQDLDVGFTSISRASDSNVDDALLITTAGTLARPADSPDVIAVGAICANESGEFALLPDSSIGPVFGDNGTAPSVTQYTEATTKPEIVSAGQVSTSLLPLTDADACDGSTTGSETAGGYYGTAAAAAHAGGMAALLLSNDDMSNVFTPNEIGVNAIQNYMQARVVELPIQNPDGFDMSYGAGLSVLGAPGFRLQNSYNGLFVPDLLAACPIEDTIFVGQGRVSGTMDGSMNTPYLHVPVGLQAAADLAIANSRTFCVVVMPGEYPTPIYTQDDNIEIYSYNEVTSITFPATIIRVSGLYDNGEEAANPGYNSSLGSQQPIFANRGGLYLDNTIDVVIDGFHFVPTTPYTANATARQPLMLNRATTNTFRNNVFGATSIDGVTYSSWGIGSTPITVIEGGGSVFENNTFINNTGGYIDDRLYVPTIALINASSLDRPVVFRNNHIEGNTATALGSSTQFWPTLLYNLNTHVDIVGNVFLNNDAGSLITTVTENASSLYETRIFSNVFQYNTAETRDIDDLSVTSGPIVHAYYTRNLSFLNNNVVVNDLSNSSNFGAVLLRGDSIGTSVTGNVDGTIDGSTQFFDFFNNIVYNNTMTGGVYNDPSVTIISACNSLANGANQAIVNSWVHSSGTHRCTLGGNGNSTADPVATNEFIGPLALMDPLMNVEYYALNFKDLGVTEYGRGMDYSNVNGQDITLGTYPFDVDARSDDRIVDIENWENLTLGGDTGTYTYDVGAFEFDELDIVDANYFKSANEDADVVSINMRDVIRGGIGTLSYTIDTPPLNYGIQCGPTFTGDGIDPAGIDTVSREGYILYCPPPDMYTDSDLFDPNVPDQVSFGFTAVDQGGLDVSGTLPVRIAPDRILPQGPDSPLTETVGDDNPLGDVFSVVADIGSTINIKLRPYVEFGPFFFSERNNPSFIENGRYMVEYPFGYTIDAISGDVGIIDSYNHTPNSADLQVTLSESFTGEAVIEYTVTDYQGNSTTNYLRLRAISRIPVNPGLYDDSSFAFEYTNLDTPTDTGWEAEESDGNINNTLHVSSQVNDVASFGFRGTGFTLYMQGETFSGGFWDLYIDQTQEATPLPVTGWTDAGGVYTTTDPSGLFTCTTTEIALDLDGNNSLHNRSRDMYTVTCESTDNGIHIVEIHNRDGRNLSVDAFSLVSDPNDVATGPFTPGVYEVTHPEMQRIFTGGWTQVANLRYSNGLGYAAIGAASDITFTVQGGSGFALETVLDVTTGTYTMCVTDVTPSIGTNMATCQRYDNSPATVQRFTTNAFRSFYGLDTTRTYQVDITNVQGNGGSGVVIDSLRVLPPSLDPTGLVSGAYEIDDFSLFALGGGLEDTWVMDTREARALDRSAIELERRVPAVGPFIAFRVPADVNTIYYSYKTLRPSTQAMVCVDRGEGVDINQTNAFGNCLRVDLSTGAYTAIQPNGSDGTSGNILVVDGTIGFAESHFATGWTSTNNHTVEIFSLVDEEFSLDRVIAVGTDVPLTAGYYEEYTTSLSYLKSNGTTAATITRSTSPRTTDYTGDFTQVYGVGARRDGGAGLMYTRTIGNMIHFNMEGTGFASHFRIYRTGGAIRACWLPYAGTPADANTVLAGSYCQTFDTESLRPGYNVPFRIVGLPYGTYSVVLEYLGDDFVPEANRFGHELYFDGVSIFNDDLTVDDTSDTNDLALRPLITGQVTEGNYDNRLENNYFAYFGTDWQTLASNLYSNGDYDTVRRNVAGSMVAFRVENANAIKLYQNLSRAYGDVVVCATDEADATRRLCSIIFNDTNINGDVITLYLNRDGAVGNYLVTVMAREERTLVFDAVEPIDVSGPLVEGVYDDNHPSIVYNRSGANLVLNGDMEANNSYYWPKVGSPTTSQSTTRYTGRYSWLVQAGAANQGIQSLPFDLYENQTYTALARVNVQGTSGAIRLRVVDSSQSLLAEFVEQGTTLVNGNWTTLRYNFSLPVGVSYTDARLQILTSGSASFYVDDVYLMDGSNWQTLSGPNRFYNDAATGSITNGAEASFLMYGTGFSVGTLLDRTAGEVQYCYLEYSGVAPSNGDVLDNGTCVTFDNESLRAYYDSMRIVSGLPLATYKVVIKDVEDGNSSSARIYPDERLFRYATSNIVVDWVQIFNDLPPILNASGAFNEDYVTNGETALLSLPPSSWGAISGTTAARYSDGSYNTVIDSNQRRSRNIAGPAALLQLNIPAGEAATIILDTYQADRTASDLLLACAGGIEGAFVYDGANYDIVDNNGEQNCVVVDDLVTNRFLTFNSSNLPLLENNTGSPVSRIFSVQTASAGYFDIDGFQVLYGTALKPGFYEDTIGDNILTPTSGTWTTIASRFASGGTAFVSSSATNSLTFTFEGSGVSIMTAYERNGGSLSVNVTDGGSINKTENIDTNTGIIKYGEAITIAGLPYNPASPTTYTVTITGTNDALESVLVDGIRVYDELTELGSLYDDAQVDVAGELLLQYGPTDEAWEARTGRNALGAMNETLHVARSQGAVATFEIGADPSKLARGISLYYHDNTTAATVDVCFRDATSPATEDCHTVTVNDDADRKDVIASGGLGNYYVTITNTAPRVDFYLDAVQVLESDLTEGIHTAAAIDSVGTLGGGANFNASSGIITLGNGSFVEFDLTGIGFSFILDGTVNGDYQLDITDTLSATLMTSTIPTNSAFVTNGEETIAFMGLHAADGSDRMVTVRLTNNGASQIRVTGVHVLGDNDSLLITDTARYEDNDPQLRYLPFSSYLEEVLRFGPSDFNQHVGSTHGAVAYFEFNELAAGGATGYEYFRQLRTFGHGNVEICYGAIGTDTLADARDHGQCASVSNTTANTYQASAPMSPTAGFCATGCWATLRSRDTSTMTVDYVRLFDAEAALQVGFYEEDYSGLQYSGGTWTRVENRRASNSYVYRHDVPSNITTYNGAVMSYLMEGTGTTVYFTNDRNADAVRICMTPYTGTETVTDALNGHCQTFDNENRVPRYISGRTVSGLPFGEYLVAVQAQPDNADPALHSSIALPIRVEIDAVRVYGLEDADWANLDVLTPGRVYETSYVNRDGMNDYIYYGDSWQTLTGSAANGHSNRDYDRAREYGAGITFRVSGGDAVILYTELRRNYSPLRICATPLDAGLTSIADDIRCRDYSLDGTGKQQPLVFHLSEFGVAPRSNYAVTISALTDSFSIMDAIEVVDTSTLQPGYYESTDPSVVFPGGYEQFVVNGLMEANRNWDTVSNATATFNTAVSFEGAGSYLVSASTSGSGIQSERFELNRVGVYTVQARVRVNSGSIRLKLIEGSDFNSIAEFNETTMGSTSGQWRTIRTEFTLAQGLTYEDYANIASEGLVLQIVADGGSANFYIDDVKLIFGGRWQNSGSPRYSGNGTLRSETDGATLYFAFEGTGVQLGMSVDRYAGEVQVCYDDDASFDEQSETNNDQSCFTYQNEDRSTLYDFSRVIAGLPYGTYYVRVRDVENGLTVTNRIDPNAVRNARWLTGQVGLDYIRVFDENPMPIVPSGYYNEDAVDGNGDAYLQLFPYGNWDNVTGGRATRYSEGSYLASVDNLGRLSRNMAGPSGVLYVDVPDEGATVLLYTGPASRTNTDTILICAGNTMNGELTWNGAYVLNSAGDDCVLRNATVDSQLVVTPDDLAALGTAGVTRVQFTSLTRNFFNIDGYQVIEGSVLSPGIYDNLMPDNLLDFDAGSNELTNDDRLCATSAYWCEKKFPRSFGESYVHTQVLDATLTFQFDGTGFGVITNPSVRGADMSICYQRTPLDGSLPNFPSRTSILDGSGNVIWDNTAQDMDNNGIWCDVVTTNTNPRAIHPWEERTPDRINPRNGYQYTFSYYGLPNSGYSVQVMMVDTTIAGTANTLVIDAITIYSDRRALPIMSEGQYDDADNSISYEPSVFWTLDESRFGPSNGTFAMTEHNTRNSGAIAQMRIDGNGVTLYQTVNTTNSSDIQLCMLVTGATIHCASGANTTAQLVQENEASPGSLPAYALAVEMVNFSQNGRRSYFTPILFYGMGEGDHDLIFENRDHNRTMSFDAIVVHD